MFVINYSKSTKIANFSFSSVLFRSFIYLLALRNFIMESKKPRTLKRELSGSEYKQRFGSGGKGKLILNRKKPLTGLGLLVR